MFGGSRLTSVASSFAPDLVNDAIVVAPENPALGSVAQIAITVRNLGLSASGATVVETADDGTLVGSPIAVPMLGPGASVTVAFDWNVPHAAAAPRSLRARVDVANAVNESDETNNERTWITLRPDLVVHDLVVDRVDGRLVVSARVSNEGSSGITAPFQVALRLDAPDAAVSLATREIATPLAVGQSTDVVFEIDDPLAIQELSHTAFIVADSERVITESDETNNSAFGLLTPFTSWQNPFNRFDVNNDTHVVPQDVLLLVNRLNQFGSFRLFVPAAPPLFLDVNGDGFIAPLDVLQSVNFLNANPAGEDGSGGALEGEGASEYRADPSVLPIQRRGVDRIAATAGGRPPAAERQRVLAEAIDWRGGWPTARMRAPRIGNGNLVGTAPDDELIELLSRDVRQPFAAGAEEPGPRECIERASR